METDPGLVFRYRPHGGCMDATSNIVCMADSDKEMVC